MLEFKIEFRILATMVNTLRKLDIDTSRLFKCWSCVGYPDLCENCEIYHDDVWDKVAVLLTAGA